MTMMLSYLSSAAFIILCGLAVKYGTTDKNEPCSKMFYPKYLRRHHSDHSACDCVRWYHLAIKVHVFDLGKHGLEVTGGINKYSYKCIYNNQITSRE